MMVPRRPRFSTADAALAGAGGGSCISDGGDDDVLGLDVVRGFCDNFARTRRGGLGCIADVMMMEIDVDERSVEQDS